MQTLLIYCLYDKLKKHITVVDRREKLFKSNDCDLQKLQAHTKEKIKVHIKEVHTLREWPQWENCDTKWSLINHMVI